VVVTALAVGIGVLTTTPPRPAPVDPLAARLTAADTTAMTVRRVPFCGEVDDATAAAALGGPVTARTAWQPGDRVAVSGRVKDIADEYGCSWATASGARARAWVFAPPVTPERAAELATAKPTAGCTPASRMPAYGAPTSALTCGDRTVVRGLFGDAWLTCELTSHDLDLVGRWCLAVARAAG